MEPQSTDTVPLQPFVQSAGSFGAQQRTNNSVGVGGDTKSMVPRQLPDTKKTIPDAGGFHGGSLAYPVLNFSLVQDKQAIITTADSSDDSTAVKSMVNGRFMSSSCEQGMEALGVQGHQASSGTLSGSSSGSGILSFSNLGDSMYQLAETSDEEEDSVGNKNENADGKPKPLASGQGNGADQSSSESVAISDDLETERSRNESRPFNQQRQTDSSSFEEMLPSSPLDRSLRPVVPEHPVAPFIPRFRSVSTGAYSTTQSITSSTVSPLQKRRQAPLDPVTLEWKQEVVPWFQHLLKQSGRSLGQSDGQVKLNEELKDGVLLCCALNTLLSQRAGEGKQMDTVPLMNVSDAADAAVVNLVQFVRTSELVFRLSKQQLMDPIAFLNSESETAVIRMLYYIKKESEKPPVVAEQSRRVSVAEPEERLDMKQQLLQIANALERMQQQQQQQQYPGLSSSASVVASDMKLSERLEDMAAMEETQKSILSRLDNIEVKFDERLSQLTALAEDNQELMTSRLRSIETGQTHMLHVMQSLDSRFAALSRMPLDISNFREDLNVRLEKMGEQIGHTVIEMQSSLKAIQVEASSTTSRKPNRSSISDKPPAPGDSITQVRRSSRPSLPELLTVSADVKNELQPRRSSKGSVVDAPLDTKSESVPQSHRRSKASISEVTNSSKNIKSEETTQSKRGSNASIHGVPSSPKTRSEEPTQSHRGSKTSLAQVPAFTQPEVTATADHLSRSKQGSGSLSQKGSLPQITIAATSRRVSASSTMSSKTDAQPVNSAPQEKAAAMLNVSITAAPSTSFTSLASPTGHAAKIFKLPESVLEMNLPREELFRQSVIYELIESEADYVRDLDLMVQKHFKYLEASKLLNQQELRTMFSNVEDLMPVHEQFLSALVARRDAEVVVSGLSDIFMFAIDRFMMYEEYCGNYQTAVKLYKEVRQREDMKRYLEMTMNSPEFRGLSLESFLIKPVQRICKYPLLFKELLKNTPNEHPDRTLLQEAVVKMEDVVMAVNARAQQIESHDKLVELQERIDATPPIELINVFGRRFLREGPIQIFHNGKVKERYLILLSDAVIVCKTQMMTNRYLFDSMHNLLTASVSTTIKASVPNPKLVKFMFELSFDGSDSLLFYCEDDQERNKWISSLEEALKGKSVMKIATARTVKPSSAPAVGTRQSSGASLATVVSLAATLRKSNTLFRRKSSKWGWKTTSDSSGAESDSARSTSPVSPSFDPYFDLDPESVAEECEILVIATRDYVARRPSQVNFQTNAYMRVTNNSRTDFWKIRMKGVLGWIPAQFVQIVDPSSMNPDDYSSMLENLRTVLQPNITMYGIRRRESAASASSKSSITFDNTKRLTAVSDIDTQSIPAVEEEQGNESNKTVGNSAAEVNALKSSNVTGVKTTGTAMTPANVTEYGQYNDSAVNFNSMPSMQAQIQQADQAIYGSAPQTPFDQEHIGIDLNSAADVPDPSSVALVPGYPDWRSVRTTASNMVYYFNYKTGESSWFPPGFERSTESARGLVIEDPSTMHQEDLSMAIQKRSAYLQALQFHQQRLIQHLDRRQ